MNIVEAFIKFNGGIVIIISGLSGSGKTSIAKFIERDFKLKLINIDDYAKKNVDNIVELSNGIKIVDWDDVNTYDWDKINKKVNEYKSNGVILCGPYFPTDLLKFEPHFHIQIKTPKQILIEKRVKFINANKDKFKTLFESLTNREEIIESSEETTEKSRTQDVDTSIVAAIVNQITYPHFLEYTQKSKIDKFVNAKDLNKDQIYDQVADFLFFKINENLQEKDGRTINKVDSTNTKTSRQNAHKNNLIDDSSDSVKTDPNFDDSSDSTSISDSNKEEERKPVSNFLDPEVNPIDDDEYTDEKDKPIFIGTTQDEESTWRYRYKGPIVGNNEYSE